MNLLFRWLLVAAALSAAPSLVLAAPARVQVKGTRVSMVPPEGFTEARLYSGFRKADARASIRVKDYPIPGTYDFTVQRLSEGFEAEGTKVLDRKEVKVEGQTGQLLKLRKASASGNFLTWFLVLEDPSGAVVIHANWREEDTKTLEGPLQAAVLSARWNPKAEFTPGPQLFTLKQTPGLKEAQRSQSLIFYTRDGKPVGREPAQQAAFMVIPSAWATSAGDDLAAANLQQLQDGPGVKDVTVESSAPLTVAGLVGHELVARAKSTPSGRDITVYQALLVTPDRYFLLRGYVENADREAYLKHFKAATQAFQPVTTP